MSTFVALDFETADRGRDSACALGLVRVDNNNITKRYYSLIRPPREFFEFTYIHGIRWSDVALEQTFDQIWPSIECIFSNIDFIAAHNASFDKGVLYACCDSHQISKPKNKFICTVKLSRKLWDIYPTKLPNVCEYLNIKLDHHYALSDAEACAQIVIASEQI